MARTKGNSKMQMVTFHSTISTVKITSKTCAGKCGEEKPISEFNFRSSNADGRSGICKVCTMDAQRVHVQRKKKEKDYWAQFSPI